MQTGFCLKISNRCNLFVVSRLCPDIFCFAFLSLSFFILCANDLLKLSLSIESGWQWQWLQVLASECCDISYNDLDLIFTVDLPTQKHYERVSGVLWVEKSTILTPTFLGEAGSFGLIAGPLTWTDFKEANVFLHIERSICVENGESERQW